MSKALVEGEYFRVHPITRLSKVISDTKGEFETLDWKEGLGIEKKVSTNPDLYMVVAFVKPDEFGRIVFEDVDFRSIFELDATKVDMVEEFQNCVEFARSALEDVRCE